MLQTRREHLATLGVITAAAGCGSLGISPRSPSSALTNRRFVDEFHYLMGHNSLRLIEREDFSRPDFLEALMREGMVPLSYARRSLEHKGMI